MFLDDLLTSYQQIETSFAKHLYQFYKGFEFRSLWDVSDKLTKFQRLASEAARGNGILTGSVELTNAVDEINKIESFARGCFTKMIYFSNKHKWSFDSVKDRAVWNHIRLLRLIDN